jgi:hypothetical protein
MLFSCEDTLSGMIESVSKGLCVRVLKPPTLDRQEQVQIT